VLAALVLHSTTVLNRWSLCGLGVVVVVVVVACVCVCVLLRAAVAEQAPHAPSKALTKHPQVCCLSRPWMKVRGRLKQHELERDTLIPTYIYNTWGWVVW